MLRLLFEPSCSVCESLNSRLCVEPSCSRVLGVIVLRFTQICHSGVDTVHLCVDTSSLSQKPVL
ncbi:hypothetical protein Taro_020632, partial [Colocasia esculenta]|nr:hypothetical protein [Colocasia esculenta]